MIHMTYDPPPGAPVILYEDDELLVIDKASGLLSVPGKGEGKDDCLISRLLVTHPQVKLVHRLDCDTSGVIIFGLTPKAQAHLGQQFEKRRTEKRYVALVAGHPAETQGRVDLPLKVDWENRPKQRVDFENGKSAQTDWQVERLEGPNARMVLKPLTGRSHQLRVHMLSLGHPILGDPLYSEKTVADFPRLMLHAEELSLRHPANGASMTFRAPVPF